MNNASKRPPDHRDTMTSTVLAVTTAAMNNVSESSKNGSLPAKVSYASISTVLAILILGGNGIFILAYLATRLRSYKRKVNYMYFMIHLAVADLFVGISIPYHIALFFDRQLSKSSIYICAIRYSTIAFPMCASVLCLLAITLDRYIALSRPMRYLMLVTKVKRHVAMAVIWLSAFLYGVVGIAVSINRERYERERHCEMTKVIKWEYLAFILVPGMVLVTPLIAVFYFKVILIVCDQGRERRKMSIEPTKETFKMRQEVRVAQTGLIVLGVFYACWLPFLVILSVQVYGNKMESKTWDKARTVATFPAMANSAMNTFIYAWRLPHFRKIVCHLLKRGRRRSIGTRSFSLSSAHVSVRGSRNHLDRKLSLPVNNDIVSTENDETSFT